MIQTGLINKWVLVYNKNNKVLIKQYNDNQNTSYNEDLYILECFETDIEMQDRIVELDLEDLPKE